MESANKYPIWIGIFTASDLVMIWLTPNPIWWMICALGIGANGLVCAANGWKMPVAGCNEETVRHCPMIASTRYKWLADVIPTGLGKASIGDIFLAAGFLGAVAMRASFPYAKIIAVLCLMWWASGWARGFLLFEKWTAEARRDARKNIPIVPMLMLLGNLFHLRGCSVGELQASVKHAADAVAVTKFEKHPEPQPKWRDLGKVFSPSPKLLRRLREETAKQEQNRKQSDALKVIIPLSNSQTIFFSVAFTEKAARKGPFCRVTCAAHHGGEYDVETAPELCRANWIPPTAGAVPGWIAMTDKYEERQYWPGPAQTGFEKYTLYWSSIQSEAKIISQSGSGSVSSK